MTVLTTMSNWILNYHAGPSDAPHLVCFPHAGGSGSFFYPVSNALKSRANVLAIQYPGRQDRRQEPFLKTIEALAEAVVSELEPYLDRPVLLFGHSMGAAVAFETALRLEKAGSGPKALIVSGRCAPSIRRDRGVWRKDGPDLIKELRRNGGTEVELLGDDEFVDMILPAVRSDYQAIESYCCQDGARLACPIISMVGDSDHMTSLEDAKRWAEHTNAEFRLEEFSGGHFYLIDQAANVIESVAQVCANHGRS